MHLRRGLRGRFASILGVVVVAAPAVAQHAITRVSVDSNGVEGDIDSGISSAAAFSSDGRYVAFDSFADNLVPADGNFRRDVFVRDRVTATTVRVSVDSLGIEGDGDSIGPALSSDGRFVAFESSSDNLVASDGNHTLDIFVHDRDPDANGTFDEGNGVTTRVSVSSSGGEGDSASFSASISGDGNFVVFTSAADNLVPTDKNRVLDVFLHNRKAGTTFSQSIDATGSKGGNGPSYLPRISADGAFIAFSSSANNLVASDTNGRSDVFLRDRVNKLTTRISVDSAGVEGNGDSVTAGEISADGQIVAFWGYATNLVAGDTNFASDVFVHDRATGLTERVSVDSTGLEGDFSSYGGALSADGQVVAFVSIATNLVAGDTNGVDDVFVHDLATGVTSAASFNCAEVAGNGASYYAALSGDGLVVAYTSYASDLVAADTNGANDVFVHDRTVVEPAAAWNNYDVGYPGTNGIPTLTASGNPVFGTTITLDVSNSFGFFTVGFMLIGSGKASIPTNDGGSLLVDFTLILPLAVWPGGLSLPADIPADPALCGASAYLQVVEMDPGAQYGLSFTPGLELLLGH